MKCRDRGVCPDNKMKQGYNDRLDESLAMRDGKESSKSQSFKSRRDESEGMEKKMGRRKYASVRTMDKARRKVKGKKDRY